MTTPDKALAEALEAAGVHMWAGIQRDRRPISPESILAALPAGAALVTTETLAAALCRVFSYPMVGGDSPLTHEEAAAAILAAVREAQP